MRVVILDSYDSFTFNLHQRLGELGADPVVRRNDELTVDGLRALEPDRLIISPGPGRPEDPAWFGIGTQAILDLGGEVPILGVCLGHLGIIHAHGGRVVRAPEPRHGKTSAIEHDGRGIFRGLDSPLVAMRYHSLVGEEATLPACLEISARVAGGPIMAVRHRELPLVGVQFHPESIGTPDGPRLLRNFLEQ